MPYNVLIVEDQEMPRQLFEIFIESSENYEHAGSVSSAQMAIDICREKKIDLVLMDVCTAMNSNGLDASEEIKKFFPNIKIIIVTSMPEYSWIERAKQIGIDSFWYKDVRKDSILKVMDKTMEGEHIFPDSTPLVFFGNTTNHDLTERELDILREIITGDSNAEIADRLGISERTVKNYVQTLLDKTGFHTRTELASMATASGIVVKL